MGVTAGEGAGEGLEVELVGEGVRTQLLTANKRVRITRHSDLAQFTRQDESQVTAVGKAPPDYDTIFVRTAKI